MSENAERVAPEPGDVVTIDRPYCGVKLGARAVIDGSGAYGDGTVMVVVGASAFWGPSSAYAKDQTEVVSCSGGPCPAIPEGDLVYLGTTEQSFWKWADTPRRDGGVGYKRTVSLWSWPAQIDGS